MKDKNLIVKVNEQFIEKVDYLKRINDYKNRSDTIRKTVEKEYRKETTLDCQFSDECEYADVCRGIRCMRYGIMLPKEKEDGR